MRLYERRTKSDTDIWAYTHWFNWAVPLRIQWSNSGIFAACKKYKRLEIHIGPFEIIFGHGKVIR